MKWTEELTLSALIERARAADRAGAWQDALEGYRLAAVRIRAGEQPECGPEVLRRLGRLCFEQGAFNTADEALEASLVQAHTLGLDRDAAAALNGLALVAQYRGRLDVAEAFYARASAIAEQTGDQRLAAQIDENLGTLANTRGDLASAATRLQSALERFDALGEDEYCASTLRNLARLQLDVGELAAAEMSLNAAHQLAERAGDKLTLAKIETHRAESAIKRQQFESAQDYCENAYALFTDLNSRVGLAEVHRLYGMLMRGTLEPECAQEQLNTALELARSAPYPMLEANAESELAELFLTGGQISLALRSLNRALLIYMELDARREVLDVRRRLDRLESTYLQAIRCWTDDDTNHIVASRSPRRGERVVELAVMLAAEVDYDDMTQLRIGASLHDIGNKALPSEVLLKPGLLTADEWDIVRYHPVESDALVGELQFPADVRSIVRNHHEHWDGSGYPDHLRGEEIPLAARILCLADVYDALTTVRPYRNEYTSEQALAIMEKEAGSVFDPKLMPIFAQLIRARVVEAAALRAADLRHAV